MGINSNTQVGLQNPGLQQFYNKAADSGRRVISEGGQVKTATRLHKGHTYQVFSEHVLRKDYPQYHQENVKANLDLLKALLREESPQVAMLAYSLIEPAAQRGEPLTKRNILEVKTLVEQVHRDPATYEKRLKQFDTISRDPRLQVCLENFYPGKMDGIGWKLLEKAKAFGKDTGANVALNFALPGLGSLISVGRSLYKASVNCDAELHHKQVLQIASLPGREGSLAATLGQALIRDHEQQATDAATSATLGTATAGLGAFGPAGAAGGAMPVIKNMVEGAVGGLAGKGVATAVGFSPTIASMAATRGVEYAADQVRNQSLGILPRLEVSNDQGDFTFSMKDPASVRALLVYLGASEDKSLTAPGAPKEACEMEQARLALKASLGSSANENLVSGDPELSSRPSDEVYRKLLADDYNWLMPGVRAVDEGKASEINQRLTTTVSMEFDGRTVWDKRSPNLTGEQISALEKDGSPSLLRLMYLAEGWL